MPGPFVNGIIPSFKLGEKHVFIVSGSGFVEGRSPIKVELKNTAGDYGWTVEPNKTKFLSTTEVEITAKVIKRIGEDAGGGVGDLTITVTNGDGTTTPPSSVQVYYDDSPDRRP